MPTNQSSQILTLVDELEKKLHELSSTDDLQELRALVQRPGWTTLAEQTFVTSQLSALVDQVEVVVKLREALLGASKQVGGRQERDSPPAVPPAEPTTP